MATRQEEALEAEKTAFIDSFRDLMSRIGLEVRDGAEFKVQDARHRILELNHQGDRVAFWPVAAHEIPKGSTTVLVEAARALLYPKLKRTGEALRLVVILQGQRLTPEDHERALLGDQPIYLWEQNALDYYSELRDTIGHYTRSSLLGELGLQIPDKGVLRVLAMRAGGGRQSAGGTVESYTFLADPKRLLEIAYVARREVRGELFYQRLIKKGKIASIAEFIDDGNVIPNNIILAFGEHIAANVRFEPIDIPGADNESLSGEIGFLEFPRDYRSLWIIDGQHRLFGFSRSATTIDVPFTVFRHLPLPEQAQMFIDINKNQTAVNPDFVWDIQAELAPLSDMGIIGQTVKALAQTGPLEGHIYVPSLGVRKSNQLGLANFCRTIEKTKLFAETTACGAANPWFAKDPDQRVTKLTLGLNIFLVEFQKRIPEEWWGNDKNARALVTIDGGIHVVLSLLERMIERIGRDHKGEPLPDEFHRFIDAFDRVLTEDYPSERDLRDLRTRLSSDAGRTRVVKDFALKMREVMTDPAFADDVVREWEAKFRPLELALQNVLVERLPKEIGPKWWTTSQFNYEMVRRTDKFRKDAGDDDENNFPFYLTIQDAARIITESKDGRPVGRFRRAFAPLFLVDEGAKHGFHSFEDLKGTLERLVRVRNRFVAHANKERLKSDEERQVEMDLDRMGRLLRPYLPDDDS